jgi:hypothetical protein
VPRVTRPKPIVLPDSALVPERNLVHPPPARFTHEVIAPQPYYFIGPRQPMPPEGQFVAGTKVAVLKRLGPICRVADARGLCVVTAYDGLRPIQ